MTSAKPATGRPPGRSGSIGALLTLALAAPLLLTAAPAPAETASVPRESVSPPETTPEITTADLMAHIRNLASEAMEGRRTGEPGGRLAEEYVAAAFRRIGLEPAGENGSYFHEFEFVHGVRLGDRSRLAFGRPDAEPVILALDEEWRPLGFSAVGEAAPTCAVFVGYGLAAGRKGQPGWYDSYADGAPVKGCWALAWRGVPPGAEPERRSKLLRLASIAYKASIARSKGAVGLIVADGPGAGYMRNLPRLNFGPRDQRDAIPVLAIGARPAEDLLRAGGLDPERLAKTLDSGASAGRAARLGEVEISATVDLAVERRRGRNVLGRLAMGGATDPSARAPVAMMGAHLDHLGRGGDFSSLARPGEEGQIHYGADDNASGVAAVLEIAERMAADRDRMAAAGAPGGARDVVFVAWMGEELGLIGSGALVNRLKAQAAALKAEGAEVGAAKGALSDLVAAYLNLDMVGRLEDKVKLSGIGSSPVWRPEVERWNASLDLPVTQIDTAYLPTDATSFYGAGVPVLSVSTGQHDEYHSPRDKPALINAEGLAKVAEFMRRFLAARVADAAPPGLQATSAGGERTYRRSGSVYIGVAPDFAQGAAPGVSILGVVDGGPADEAGLAGGDRLIELAGQELATSYDFIRVLNGLAAGETVEAVIVRRGERQQVRLTPRLRE